MNFNPLLPLNLSVEPEPEVMQMDLLDDTWHVKSISPNVNVTSIFVNYLTIYGNDGLMIIWLLLRESNRVKFSTQGTSP